MSVEISPALSNDAWIRSSSGTYGNVLFGNDLVLNNNDSIAVVGQTGGSTYYVRQYFVQFPYSRPSDQIAVSAYFRFYNSVTHGTNVARDVEIREYQRERHAIDDEVTIEDRGDWRTPSQGIAPLTISGVFERAHALPNNSPAFAGFMRVRAQLSESDTLSYIVNSSRNRLQQISSGTEYNTFASSRADGAGTANDPQLVVGFHTLSRMTTVLAAQTQLSDGSWIYLERNNLNDEFTMDVKRMTSGGTVTTIASNFTTGVTGNDNMRSAQGYGLCADKDDNFFVTYPRYDNTEHLAVRGYKKGVGTTWTQGSELYWLNWSDDNYANTMQVLCAWHDIGSGRLVVFAMRDWGRHGGSMDTYFLLDSSKILNNQSSGLVLTSGRGGVDGWLARPANAGNYNPINSTGTLFDLIPDAVNTHTGYILTAERAALLDQNAATSVGRYRIHSNGITFNSNTFSFMDNNGGYSQHDPDSKLRAISVGQHDLVKIAADARNGWGLTLDRFSFGSTTNTQSLLGRVRMSGENIASFPDRSGLNEITTSNKLNNSQLWDAVYFPSDNKIWIYYLDDTDATLRTLRRTSINLNDNLATKSEVEVTTTLGEAGYTPLALRVQRNNMRSDHCMITVAYVDSSDVHKYDYHIDRINIAPTQPLLNPVTNFNANNNKEFTWVFSDPNFVDSQSKYRIQIIDRSDSSVVYDEEVTSTNQSHTVTGGSIANDKNYFWKVKTWDSEGEESPWSSQGTVATSDSAIITITNPATDNEEIFTKDVLIEWDREGAQDEYRVTVTRVSDGVDHESSTGWVTSQDNSHLITDLVSDVEYLVTVVSRNNGIESNSDSRLVLVHYNTPELPEISVTVTPDSEYVTVAVTNPEPRGDRPNPTVNEVYRRVAGTNGPYQWVGDCEPNTSFQDYSVGSGYNYEYKVRAGVEA